MDITFECDKCGQAMIIEESGAGATVDCSNCGNPTYVPTQSPTEPPPADEVVTESPDGIPATPPELPTSSLTTPPAPAIDRVVMTDIQMPFWSMVVFMIKWAIAAIPAALVLMSIFFILWLIIAGLGFGLFSHMFR